MDEQKPLENKQGEPGKKIEKSEYSFMQETIKDENSRGKKCRKDLLRMAGLGVVFGVCACISFSALKPWLDKKFPGDSQEVVIPKEKEEDNTEEKKADTSNNTEQTLDIDNYRELQKAMNDVATEAGKSVVEIIGVSGEQDWTDESYDNKNSVSGLIIADNGQELLVYGKTSILKDAKEIHIRFSDGNTEQASVKKKDESLGFAIYAVSGSSIEQSTWTQISTAKPILYRKGTPWQCLESHLAMQERSDLERLRTAEMNWMQMTEVISSFALILVRQKTEQV
jgi:serine protease Do